MEGCLLKHFFSGHLQAFWRGFSLRKRLASALAVVRNLEIEEDEVLEELDMEDFVLDEVCKVYVFVCFTVNSLPHFMTYQTLKPVQSTIHITYSILPST